MVLVGDALFDEVLAATPDDEQAKRVTKEHKPYSLWRLDLDAIAAVEVEYPVGQPGTIETLFPSWLQWLAAAAKAERKRYETLLGRVRSGLSFNHRPILLPSASSTTGGLRLLDGKQRLFAAWGCRTALPDLTIEVFVGF